MAGGRKRRLAAIMFTDIVGYSRFMEEDELHGRLIRDRHKDIFEKYTQAYHGKVIQYFGDGTLSIFDSALSAVECAVNMQRAFRQEPQVPLRIGIHLGDILYDDTEAFGHGVNVAARIEPVCNPGGILISDKVYDEIRNQSTLKSKNLGLFHFRNMDRPVGLYAIQEEGVAFPSSRERAFMKELSQKMHITTVAERSEAFKQFLASDSVNQRQKWMPWMGNLLLIVLLALGFNFIKGSIEFPISGPERKNISIAVLPFVNMNATDENQYFTNGMTEDILTLISKLDGFSVTSRTSVMQYINTDKSMRDIGRELGVGHLLEGSVRREGNKVRITAQLIDAEKDEHIWAKTYDEELTSIFDVQSNVAGDIARQLRKKLSPDERLVIDMKPTENITAYEDYLKGRELYRKYNPKDNDLAIGHFYKALQADPDYAYAFAGLGDAYAQKAFHHNMDPSYLDTAELHSKRAIELNPGLSEGYKALGLTYHYKGQLNDALKEYQKAIQKDPYNDMASNNIGQIEVQKGNFLGGVKWAEHTLSINKNIPTSVLNLAHIHYDLGDDQTAKRIVDDGITIHPEAPELREMKGQILLREGKYKEARLEAEKVIAINPKSPDGYSLMSEIFIKQKEWEKARKEIQKAREKMPEKQSSKTWNLDALAAYVEGQLGNTEEARIQWSEILNEIDNLEPEKIKAYKGLEVFKGIIFSELGNDSEAIKNIEKAKGENWINYKEGMEHPLFEDLRKMPEFQRILSEIKVKADSIKKQLPASIP